MSAECSVEDSFTVEISGTDYAFFNGCYINVLDSNTGSGLPWFTLDGVLEEGQILVYGSTAFDDDHEVWAFGLLDETLEDNGSKYCRDDELQDASTVNPSEVSNWMCYSSEDDDYTRFLNIDSTCNCFTPAPISTTPAPTPSARITTPTPGPFTTKIFAPISLTPSPTIPSTRTIISSPAPISTNPPPTGPLVPTASPATPSSNGVPVGVVVGSVLAGLGAMAIIFACLFKTGRLRLVGSKKRSGGEGHTAVADSAASGGADSSTQYPIALDVQYPVAVSRK